MCKDKIKCYSCSDGYLEIIRKKDFPVEFCNRPAFIVPEAEVYHCPLCGETRMTLQEAQRVDNLIWKDSEKRGILPPDEVDPNTPCM